MLKNKKLEQNHCKACNSYFFSKSHLKTHQLRPCNTFIPSLLQQVIENNSNQPPLSTTSYQLTLPTAVSTQDAYHGYDFDSDIQAPKEMEFDVSNDENNNERESASEDNSSVDGDLNVSMNEDDEEDIITNTFTASQPPTQLSFLEKIQRIHKVVVEQKAFHSEFLLYYMKNKSINGYSVSLPVSREQISTEIEVTTSKYLQPISRSNEIKKQNKEWNMKLQSILL